MDLERLYKENYRIVYGYLLSLCEDPHFADDLTSETFLRGIQSIGKFKEGKISTWLCAIGRNLYLNEVKQRKHHVPLEDALHLEAGAFEQELLDKAQAKQISMLAHALDEPQKSVFFMRLHGMSFREIGEALGKNENWARVTFFRVKRDIISRLEDTR